MEEIELYNRIKEIMKEKDIQLVKLAESVGMEKGNMSAVVSGKRNPTLKTLMAIANALGVSMAEMFEKPKEHPTLTGTCPHCGKPIDVSCNVCIKSSEQA